MYSDGHEVDGSWVLRVFVTDLQVERSLRVKGELHVGGVMLRLVEDLGKFFFSFLLLIYSWYVIVNEYPSISIRASNFVAILAESRV